MEKRLVAAILLTVVFLLFYTTIVKPPEDASQGTSVEKKDEKKEAPLEKRDDTSTPDASPEVMPIEDAEEVIVETDLYRAVLSTAGGRITSFRLRNFKERWGAVGEIDKEIASLEERISNNTSEILTIRTRAQNGADTESASNLAAREKEIKLEQKTLEDTLLKLKCLKEQIIQRKRR